MAKQFTIKGHDVSIQGFVDSENKVIITTEGYKLTYKEDEDDFRIQEETINIPGKKTYNIVIKTPGFPDLVLENPDCKNTTIKVPKGYNTKISLKILHRLLYQTVDLIYYQPRMIDITEPLYVMQYYGYLYISGDYTFIPYKKVRIVADFVGYHYSNVKSVEWDFSTDKIRSFKIKRGTPVKIDSFFSGEFLLPMKGQGYMGFYGEREKAIYDDDVDDLTVRYIKPSKTNSSISELAHMHGKITLHADGRLEAGSEVFRFTES